MNEKNFQCPYPSGIIKDLSKSSGVSFSKSDVIPSLIELLCGVFSFANDSIGYLH